MVNAERDHNPMEVSTVHLKVCKDLGDNGTILKRGIRFVNYQ